LPLPLKKANLSKAMQRQDLKKNLLSKALQRQKFNIVPFERQIFAKSKANL